MLRETFQTDSWLAEIVPSVGANLIRLKHLKSGAELLRTPDSDEAFLNKTEVWGLPVLFPPNRIQDGVFHFQGREYCFPCNEPARNNHIHGILLAVPWSCEFFDTAVRCVRRDNLCGHHAFRAELRYDFEDDAVTQTFRMRNESRTDMPFLLGFHSAFRLPPNAEINAAFADNFIPRSARMLPELPERPLSGEVRHALAHPQDVPVSVHLRRAERAGDFTGMRMKRDDIAFSYVPDEKFRYWIFLNSPGHDGFFCAEPQTCMVNAPNVTGADSGFTALKPDEEIVLRSRIVVEK